MESVRGIFIGVFLLLGLTVSAADLQETANEANRLVMAGDYASALPLLKDLVVKLKNDDTPAAKKALEWARFQLAVGYLNTEQLPAALTEFENFLKSYPASVSRINVRLLMSEIHAVGEAWDKVIKGIQEAGNEGTLNREQQLVANQLFGEAQFRLGKWEAALPALLYVFRNGTEARSRNESAARYTTCLVRLERMPELFAFLPQVFATTAKYDIGLNLAMIEAGDKAFESGKHDAALLLYRMVFTKGELIRHLEAWMATVKRQLDNLGTASLSVPELLAEKRRLQRVLKQSADQLTQIKEFPDYDQELGLRVGRGYHALHRFWEAEQVFRGIYDDSPQHKLADLALYSAFAAALDGGLDERAIGAGNDYMRAFIGGEHWDRLTVGLAQLHATREEFEKALTVGRQALAVRPQHDFIAHLTYVMAYSHFQLEQFTDALQKFGDVYQKYGDRGYAEPAQYWHAMCHLFMTNYKAARSEFLTFITQYGASDLAADAHYRYAVAAYGEGDFPAAEKDLRNFVQKFPKNTVVSEAWTMIGDILASQAKLDEAIAAYRQGIATFQTMPQLNLATFQCARVYELEHRWDDIITLCSDYLKKWDRRGNYSMAAYWIGTAHMRAGRHPEALNTFFDTIVNYGDDLHAFGIDSILRDLMFETGQKLDTGLRLDFLRRIGRELDQVRATKKRTLELRLTLLLSESVTDPTSRNSMCDSLLQDANIKLASPLTLMLMGRHAQERSLTNMALHIYEHFLTNFPTSEFAGDAYQTIAQQRLTAGRYAETVPLLKALVERFASTPHAPWAQKSLGDTYRLQKQYESAIAAYNTILSVKEWRGPLWPEAIYWIAQCLQAQGNHREAFAYYQRLYVLYDGYTAWAAKGYLQSARCLEQLQQNTQAIQTYRELLTKPELAQTPEFTEAQRDLKRLGGGT